MKIKTFSNEEIKQILDGNSKIDFMLYLLKPENLFENRLQEVNIGSYKNMLVTRIAHNKTFLEPLKELYSQKLDEIYHHDLAFSSWIDDYDLAYSIIPFLSKTLSFNKSEIAELNNRLSFELANFVVKTTRLPDQKHISVLLSISEILEAVSAAQIIFKITPFPEDKLKYLKYTIKNAGKTETTHLKKVISAEKTCYIYIEKNKDNTLFYNAELVKALFKELNNDKVYQQLKTKLFLNYSKNK